MADWVRLAVGPKILFLVVSCALQAQPTGMIAGMVTDATTHEKLADVLVLADVDNKVFSALTAADGSYLLRNLPPGDVTFTVTKKGYREINFATDPDHAALTLNARDALTRNFDLRPAPYLAGRIVDYETERPVPGLSVVPLQEDYGTGVKRFIRSVAATAVSNKSGVFGLMNLEPGAYLLQVGQRILEIAPGGGEEKKERPAEYGRTYFPDANRVEAALPINLLEGERRLVEIRIRKRQLRSVNGNVEIPEGHAARIKLTLIRMQPGYFTLIAEGELKQAGRFHIDHLSEGEYVLTAEENSSSRAARLFAQSTVDVTDSDVQDLKLILQLGIPVEGAIRLVEENERFPSKLSVQLWPVTVSANAEPVLVSESGHFRFEGVSAGDYFAHLIGLPPGYVLTEMRHRGTRVLPGAPIRIDGSSLDSALNFTISTRVAAVTGTVKDAKGAAVKDARIVLLPEMIPDVMDRATLRYANSAENGQFALRDLAPGRYKAVGLDGPGRRSSADFTMLRSKSATIDAFELGRGQILNLEITP